MEGDLVLKIRAETSQMIKDIQSATKDKIKIGVDSIRDKVGAVSLPTGSNGEGIIKNAMSGAMMPMLKALGPIALLGTIVSSSKAMMASLKQVFRVLQLILKPVGDILSVGLMPIIQILKPIGKLFNSLMRPYLMKAREAMKVGGKFMKEGEYGEATKAYMLGFSYMIKPFFDLMTKSMGEIAKAPLRLMDLFGQGLVALGEKIPVVGDAFKVMGNTLSGASEDMMTKVDNTANAIIKFTDDALDTKLGEMLGTLMVKTGTATTDVIDKFNTMGINTDSIAEGMKESLKIHLEKMSKLSETEAIKVKNNVISALATLSIDAGTPMSKLKEVIISYLKDTKNEANAILRNAERKREQASEAMNRAIEYAKQSYSLSLSSPTNYYGYAKDKLGQGISTMYQVGTPFVAETGPAIVHRGERILSATENKRGGGNTYNISLPSIEVNINELRTERDIYDISSQISEDILSKLRDRLGD